MYDIVSFRYIFFIKCLHTNPESLILHHNSPVQYAKVAQLVERNLAKVEVAGSNPVFRSAYFRHRKVLFKFKRKREISESNCQGGGTGRHAGLSSLNFWFK
jgi:hypothetical protein